MDLKERLEIDNSIRLELSRSPKPNTAYREEIIKQMRLVLIILKAN